MYMDKGYLNTYSVSLYLLDPVGLCNSVVFVASKWLWVISQLSPA